MREHADKVAQRPPNAHLISEVASDRLGCSLDVGCGHGAETPWLAAHRWEVTAVDFSASALAHARSTAQAWGPGAHRVGLGRSGGVDATAQPVELVVWLYVHFAGLCTRWSGAW